MAETRSSIQRLNRTASLLGRLLLCLSLLLNLSIVAVEDLRWSAADKVLDTHQGTSAPMVTESGDNATFSVNAKEKHNPETWCRFDHAHQICSQPSIAQSAWHRRAPPTFDSLSHSAPFPPRAPTA